MIEGEYLSPLTIERTCSMNNGKKSTSPIISIQGLQQGQQYRVGRNFLLRDSGVYYRTEDKESGKDKINRIAGPLFINETTRNLDEEKVHLNLIYKQHNQYHESTVNRGQIAVPNELIKLNSSGAEIPYENKNIIVIYLREQEKGTLYREVYSKIGFHLNDKKNWEYRHSEITPKRNVKTSYDIENGTFQLTPEGSLQAWIDMIKEEVEGHSPLEFIVAVGFTAPIVGYLSQVSKNIDTLFVNLNNSTTVGKTTSAMLAVSAFGDPNPKAEKSLVQDWSSTTNSIMESLNGNMGIPIVLDELSMNKDRELTNMYYSIIAGKGKGRLTDTILQRKKATWATTILSTGEISALTRANENAGVKIRIKEYSGVIWAKSAENADNIRRVITSNYGHAGITFIEYLFKIGLQEVEKLWGKWMVRVENALPQTPYTTRLAKDYAVIMTAVTLVNEALDMNLSEENILTFIVENEKKVSLTRNTGMVAYEKIKQILIEHQINFRIAGQSTLPQNCWGKIIYHNDFIEFAIIKHILEQQLKENGFENMNTVLSEWKAEGLLMVEGDRRTKRNVIFDPNEQEQRKQALGTENLPKKREDVTYNLKIPKEELQGMLGRRRTVESFQNETEVEESLDL